MKKLIVTGANGQLGRELRRKAVPCVFDVISLDLPDFDITDVSAVKDMVAKSGARLVVNAAAYTAVDRAESESDLAYAVNCNGAANLAEACSQANIPLIHISTDYVFDGTKGSAYVETDSISPIGVYGKSKADGEAEIRKILPVHVILRTAWLYGIHGNNFVKTLLRLGQEREEIKVVNDQFGCPTHAEDLAQAVLTIAERILSGRHVAWGTWHYCGSGQTTWYEFAKKIFELAGSRHPLKVRNLIPVTTKEYPTPARRPAYSVLDCTQIRKKFGIAPPPWEESLARMLDELLTNI